MNKIYRTKELSNNFKIRKAFTTKDVVEFYQKENANIKRQTILRRISILIKYGFIKRVGKGLYSLGQEKKYLPVIDKELLKLSSKLNKKFSLLDFCFWNTKQFNEFMLHQPAIFYTIVETEKDSSEYVFNFLKQSHIEVYLNPNKSEIEKYVSNAKKSIIVKDIITEAPTQKTETTSTATLEKMLVDVFCDTDLFVFQQDAELENIFTNSFEKYTINKDKLLRYSDRRKRKQDLAEFLTYLKI